MAINKKSQEFINRIAAVMEKPPKFNLEKVTEALENYYKLLDVPMPKIEVAKDLVLGYKIVWGAAGGAAREWGRASGREWVLGSGFGE